MQHLKPSQWLALALILFSISCTKEKNTGDAPPCEPGTIDLDTVRLADNATSFIPYTGDENIYFKNAAGDEVKFEPLYPPKKHHFLDLDFDLVCDAGGANHYIYQREQYVVSHICTALNLQYFLNIYPEHSSIQPKFVDKFELLFHVPAVNNLITTSIKLEIITDFKGNEGALQNEFGAQGYTLAGEVTILNKIFKDVYIKTNSGSNQLEELFFNKTTGIVGFRDLSGELWVFDRTE